MGIIKIYHDKKWTLQFLDALYILQIRLFTPYWIVAGRDFAENILAV
jgi:hypothetical protein